MSRNDGQQMWGKLERKLLSTGPRTRSRTQRLQEPEFEFSPKLIGDVIIVKAFKICDSLSRKLKQMFFLLLRQYFG